jgi:hypothetical protein
VLKAIVSHLNIVARSIDAQDSALNIGMRPLRVIEIPVGVGETERQAADVNGCI